MQKDIICFGGEDWFYHHPVSKYHLMGEFAAAGSRVIFVNSITMGFPSVAARNLLPRVVRKARSYAQFLKVMENGITVISPPTIPFHGSAVIRRVNQLLLSGQIGALARHRGFKQPILWIAIPTAANMVGQFNETLVIYQVSDKYDANMDCATDPRVIGALHDRLLDCADIVLYSGRKLMDEADRAHDRSYLLEHGVNFDHWSSIHSGEVPVAAEIASIPSPRLGYFGKVDPQRIDQELVRRAARERPEWQWIFIGNRAKGMEIESLPTVHFLPAVDYDDLPKYAAGFDVCVLPWLTRRSYLSYGSAIKVREYLATGKPVVISPLPEYEPFSDVLRIARSHGGFLALVEEALHEQGSDAVKARQASVANGTWRARAQWVSDLVEEQLAARGR